VAADRSTFLLEAVRRNLVLVVRSLAGHPIHGSDRILEVDRSILWAGWDIGHMGLAQEDRHRLGSWGRARVMRLTVDNMAQRHDELEGAVEDSQVDCRPCLEVDHQELCSCLPSDMLGEDEIGGGQRYGRTATECDEPRPALMAMRTLM
jgi:hypothetical protein